MNETGCGSPVDGSFAMSSCVAAGTRASKDGTRNVGVARFTVSIR